MARDFPTAPQQIEAALMQSNAETLKRLIALLPIGKPRPTRKADMADAILTHLSGPPLLRLWERLDETQQLAVREALHDPGRTFRADRFSAKYGRLPRGRKNVDAYSRTPTTPLRFFLHPSARHSDAASMIPNDLAERLKAFVPPPPDAKLADCEDLPETVRQKRKKYAPKGKKTEYDPVPLIRRDMERAALQDLFTVLRLTDGKRISVSTSTRRATAATIKRIAEALHGGDFFDLEEAKPHSWSKVPGAVRAFAWPLLLQAAKLAKPDGAKLALTKAGRQALRQAPEKTLRELWSAWIDNNLLDEFNRIDSIGGQFRGKGKRAMTEPFYRRDTICMALAECPPNRWVKFDEFSRYMRAAGYEFSVTDNPWTLYIGEPRYGSLGYDGHRPWSLVQERYIACLLLEYAATLGMIDVAYVHPRGARHDYSGNWGADDLDFLSRYDGLHYFRLNPLGAYCLELTSDYTPSAPRASSAVNVFPDLRVVSARDLEADERLLLETWAKLESGNVWRLDFDKSLSAIETGSDIGELRDFLEARDDQPLPERVERFLRDTEQGAGALRMRGHSVLIECADSEVADRIMNDKQTAKLCLRAGERHVVVLSRRENAFRKAVHALGYGIASG